MIKPKSKKCKGTGKASGHGCGSLELERKYGLGIKCGCYRNWLLNTDEGKEVIEKSTIRASKQVKKEKEQAKKKCLKEMEYSTKSIAKLIHEARVPFQKLIRMRDYGKPCICCGEHLGYNLGDFDAGHWLKAELYTGLIFHPDNVHGQRKYCNNHLSGNEAAYTVNLPSRISKEKMDRMIKDKNRLRVYKWSREQLNDMKHHYNNELKKVEKGMSISDVDFSIGIIIL